MSEADIKKISPEKIAKIDSVSRSFCTAKWLQVTIDLVHGTTHSCHHPKRHEVPLDEIEKNPGALHNSQHKKLQRKMMLAGERPSECSYCWDVEDLGGSYSDRFIKTTDSWAWPKLEEVARLPWDHDIHPAYVEVMIDNTCNFSCGYCIADVSTGVAAELKKFGPFAFSNFNHRGHEHKERSQHAEFFQEAFKTWFVQIVENLKVFRITGGEPLLSKSLWWYFDEISRFDNQSLEFAINSHFSHPEALIKKLSQRVRELIDQRKIKSFDLYVSLDADGAQAEYIRSGLNFERVIKNLRLFSKLVPEANIIIMCTFNILSFGSFQGLLLKIEQLKSEMKIKIDVSYLKNPNYLRADMADQQLMAKLKSSLDYVTSRPEIFDVHEVSKIKTLLDWITSANEDAGMRMNRTHFFQFVHEFDLRKGTDFMATFPEYQSFLSLTKKCFYMSRLMENQI